MLRFGHIATSVALRKRALVIAVACAVLICTPLTSAADKAAVTAITGGMLVDGNGGPPIHDSVVIVEGSKITATGTRGTVAIPSGAKVIDARGMTVMPGLFDAHVHLLIMGHGKYDEYFPKYRSRMRNEIMPASAKELLMHGVTSVRDMGANLEDILAVRDRVNRGEIPGPRLFICGPFLQKTLPKVAFHYNMQIQSDFRWTIDSPEDARAKVRKLVAAGVDFIKVIQGTELSQAELQAIVDEAHKAGKTVATHGMDENELRTVLAAGVDTVEHTGLAPGSLPYSDDIVRALVAKNVYVDPTGMVIWRYKQASDFPEGRYDAEVEKDYPQDLVQDMEQSYSNFSALPYFSDAPGWIRTAPMRWRQLHEAGVRMLVGTDSGTPMNFHVDSTRREMQLLVANGMTPLEVITSATKYPAMLLNKGAELGTVEAGKLADIIVVKGNVLEDMGNLANVVHVMKGGELFK